MAKQCNRAQLYKTKLNEWGFTKYLPRSVAEWVLAKEKQRLREGKKTVYDYGGRRLNIAEVQRKAKRTKTQHFEASMIGKDSLPTPSYYLLSPFLEVETPNNLVYATPKTVPPSPLSPKLSPHNITSQATPQLAPRNWKPPPNSNASRPGLPRLAWNGYNRGQLESIHEDARNLASLEEFEEAEVKFCEALNGHEYLLSSVHESTSTLAYDLASFYARCDRMHDAYAVLDWIVTEHLKSSVIGDKETAAHILRVVQLLHSWSRSEEAINLLNKTLVSCQKVAGSQDHASSSSQVRPKLVNPSNKPESPEIANFMPANPATHFGDELSLVNCELKIAKSYIKAAKKEAEPLLLRLIDKCGQDPEKFSAQHFDAVCSLIELYQKPEDRYKLFAALKNAADIFWNIMEGQSGGLSILKTAIKLVRFYIQAELAPTARPMLDRIEREVTRILDEEDSEFVDVLITLGIYYQDHNGWTNAERHFEHALAIVMREHELDCRVVSTLEAALETKFFTLRLPTPEGIRATFRSNGFKRCGCSGYTGEIGGRY
jgi:hypothetical protein